MYAAIVTVTIDPAQAPAAAAALMADVLPRIRSAPGFVSGYWMEPVGGQGLSVVLFKEEEQARAATPPAIGWTAPGVTVDGVEFRRVAVAVP
ncbi:hypothetical protein ACH429_21870 [Streptomyces pathocidini]|uniref:ABM domain-containing protein n=1 Tax=Streptomyces pathocidini TaxID=1650571 RepID=A0ABW7UYF6_9ACTN|nr:hypothetical protein [Streptomyces pathocidini]